MAADAAPPGFGLYVHWPFCQAKCPYCDFNSHVVAAVDQAAWARAYEAEIARLGAATGPRTLGSIFFGGGTPSLMSAEIVDRVIAAARATWSPADDIEITLEANPTSVEAERFRGYRDAGVTRVSVGIQALNDADLRRLGRLHSVAEAREAFAEARRVFPRTSFDLIYARQDQHEAAWEAELEQALALAPDHLSLYQLTIEPGTAFGARHAAGGLAGLPDEDLGADLWEVTQRLTGAAGLPAYEVSNHARPGAESRHNLLYWTGGDYAGIGPGAHGRLTLAGVRHATETPLSPGEWLARAEAGSGESLCAPIPPEDQLAEALIMGLRLQDGVAWPRLAALGGDGLEPRIAELAGQGLLERECGRLRVTATGRPLLNAVLRELLA